MLLLKNFLLIASGEDLGSDSESVCSQTSSLASVSSETSNGTREDSTSPAPVSPAHTDRIFREPKIQPIPYSDKYSTLQPKNKKKSAKFRSVFKAKRNSRPKTLLEISAPSNAGPVLGDNSPCKISRQRPSAIRGRRKSKEATQTTIPECSFSFQITSVNVIFRGSSKMEVPCKGKFGKKYMHHRKILLNGFSWYAPNAYSLCYNQYTVVCYD